jgi:hypothetical protein
MADLNDLEAPFRLTEELLADLSASNLPDAYPLTRSAHGHIEGVTKETAQRGIEFRRKLSLRDQHLRDYHIKTNQEHKLKLFTIFTLGSFPMGDYNLSVATFRSGLERERAILQGELAEVMAPSYGVSKGPSIDQTPTRNSIGKMTKEAWVQNGWPDKLKEARGTRTQKEAAGQCGGVSVETYKKWEQGARPPKPSNLPAVLRFIDAKY